MKNRELYAGLVRLHVLHNAAKGPVYGVSLMEEIRSHGYDIRPGTLYPILHKLEAKGYLASRVELEGGRQRRLYLITPAGRRALAIGRSRVWALFHELFDDEHSSVAERQALAPKRQRRKKMED
jgi:DNA-binding PadR family transcriptional regulator